MIKKNRLKETISLSVILFINFIYLNKYAARITSHFLVIALISCSTLYIIWLKKTVIAKKMNFFDKKIYLIFYFFLALSLLYTIPKETIKVDRWSVITSFWDNFFQNQYVYYARSFDGNNPGPMPFYFIMSLPFYFLNELGLFSLVGACLLPLLFKKNNVDHHFSLYFVICVFSPFYMHEVVCRSNIFSNALIIVLVIFYFFKNYNGSVKSNIIFGIAIGCTLSTRNIFVIPYIILFIYAIKSKFINLKSAISIALIAICIFAITFIPFAWNHISDFLKINPFIIQSDYLLPLKYSLWFVFFSFAFGFFCKNKNDVYYYSGVLLFLTILFYHLLITSSDGFLKSFFDNGADVTYFLFCIPFFMTYYLSTSKKIDHIK